MSVVLTKEWHKGTMARAVPGARWDGATKAWVLDYAEARSAAIALKLFPDLGYRHPELNAMRDELAADVRPFDFASTWYEQHGSPLGCDRVRKVVKAKGWDLHEYQEVDLAYGNAVLNERGAFYMGWERGLGKTLGTCCLLDARGWESALIVAPNTAKESVWGEALREFCPWLELIVLGNTKAARSRALNQVERCFENAKPFALVVHYEALALIAGKEKVERSDGKTKTVLGNGWSRLGAFDVMVTDEDHRLANPQAQMFKGARKVVFGELLILSGSIIQNHLEELYSPHRRAFPGQFTSKWRDWNDKYLDFAEGGYGKVCLGVKQDRVDTLRNNLGTWMVYRRKEDELDLPPKTYVERRVELGPAQRRAYEELRDSCLAELDTGEKIKAQAGVAMLTKLRQIATGLSLVADDVVWGESSKLDAAVEDIMDSPDDEWVFFSWYKAGVRSLAARLESKGVECFTVDGDVPHEARTDMIDRFQRGERRVFIGTLSTLGESVNLQRACNVGRLDRAWNPMLNVQAEDRVFRMGQTRPVTITDYIAKDTVDEMVVMPNLANKLALRAAILGAS
jgi:hypothetical protein